MNEDDSMSKAQSEMFDSIHKMCANQGWCDGTGGMEYARIKREWVESGFRRPIQTFIAWRANVFVQTGDDLKTTPFPEKANDLPDVYRLVEFKEMAVLHPERLIADFPDLRSCVQCERVLRLRCFTHPAIMCNTCLDKPGYSAASPTYTPHQSRYLDCGHPVVVPGQSCFDGMCVEKRNANINSAIMTTPEMSSSSPMEQVTVSTDNVSLSTPPAAPQSAAPPSVKEEREVKRKSTIPCYECNGCYGWDSEDWPNYRCKKCGSIRSEQKSPFRKLFDERKDKIEQEVAKYGRVNPAEKDQLTQELAQKMFDDIVPNDPEAMQTSILSQLSNGKFNIPNTDEALYLVNEKFVMDKIKGEVFDRSYAQMLLDGAAQILYAKYRAKFSEEKRMHDAQITQIQDEDRAEIARRNSVIDRQREAISKINEDIKRKNQLIVDLTAAIQEGQASVDECVEQIKANNTDLEQVKVDLEKLKQPKRRRSSRFKYQVDKYGDGVTAINSTEGCIARHNHRLGEIYACSKFGNEAETVQNQTYSDWAKRVSSIFKINVV